MSYPTREKASKQINDLLQQLNDEATFEVTDGDYIVLLLSTIAIDIRTLRYLLEASMTIHTDHSEHFKQQIDGEGEYDPPEPKPIRPPIRFDE